ncbi:MAG: NADH-quinone oxidoreductase subunit D [Phycisphaerae bacterium]
MSQPQAPATAAPATRELEMYFGPQHMGMVGNFGIVLTVEGDTVVRARANPGYLHRGFEKLMEYRTYMQNFPLVCRLNVMDPDPNEALYAMAVEDLAGLQVPERAHYIRTIVLELSRISSHLMWMWAYGNMLGFDTLGQWTMGDRDYVLDLFEMLTGGRVYHTYIWPGGVRRDLPPGFADKAFPVLDHLESMLPEYDSLFFNNRIFADRTKGVAVLGRDEALAMGVTGTNLRATGVAADTRKDEPYAAYGALDFEVPTMPDGDSYSRAVVIRLEVEQSLSIIRQALEGIPAGPAWTKTPNPFKWEVPPGETYVKIESARGEAGFYMVSNGSDKPYRVHFRSPSYPVGILVLEGLLRGASLSDVGHIMLSLNVAAPEIDR